MKRKDPLCCFQMPRNERFSTDFQYKLETLIETITPYITSKYKDAPRETKNANFSLAYFVKVFTSVLFKCWHGRSDVVKLLNTEFLKAYGVKPSYSHHLMREYACTFYTTR